MKLLKLLTLLITCLALSACTTQTKHSLQQGKQLFLAHHYPAAFNTLEPLAKKGNAEAQYAIGYMYYYGQGVEKDSDIGLVWMQRAAIQGYQPAKQALTAIESNNAGSI